MNFVIKLGRAFYSLALFVYGVQQFYFGTFRNVFFSAYQQHLPALNLFAYLFGVFLIVTGVFIITGRKARDASLSLGAVLLILFLSTQVPYEVVSQPYKYYLALWVNPLKEFALAGGAFVVAGSLPVGDKKNAGLKWLNKLVPYGNLFFLVTMICFGLIHLSSAHRLQTIVPAWWPDALFWVYFTGVALVGAGVSIILGIRIRVISLLLALMIFVWFWIVHVPAGLRHPVVDRGNLLASAFDALAFTGISILIAFTMQQQRWVTKIENWKNNQTQTIAHPVTA